MEIGELCRSKAHVLSVLPDPAERAAEEPWSASYWRWPQLVVC
jgi:hypothetical protein